MALDRADQGPAPSTEAATPVVSSFPVEVHDRPPPHRRHSRAGRFAFGSDRIRPTGTSEWCSRVEAVGAGVKQATAKKRE